MRARKYLLLVTAIVAGYALYAAFVLTRPDKVTVSTVDASNLSGTDVSRSDGWDWQDEFEVTGAHVVGGGGETCGIAERKITNGNARLEGDTRVLKQDEDTHWNMLRVSDKHIQWRACANNCTFSCDTIKLLIMSKAVPLDVPQTTEAAVQGEKWGVYAEHTSEGNNLSCWVCTAASAGSAACTGNKLIGGFEWELRQQAEASACVMKNQGKCLVVQNHRCP